MIGKTEEVETSRPLFVTGGHRARSPCSTMVLIE
jgi:hypothetical protein